MEWYSWILVGLVYFSIGCFLYRLYHKSRWGDASDEEVGLPIAIILLYPIWIVLFIVLFPLWKVYTLIVHSHL